MADLMRHRTEDCGDRFGVQRRAVGRDPLDGQPACLQGLAEAAKECLDVDLGRVAVQDVEDSRLKVRLSTIDRTQNGPSYNSSAAI